MSQRIDLERVAVDDLKAAGVGRADLLQRWHTAGVFFDCQHAAGAFGQQAARKATGAGADFQHVALREITRLPRDFGGQVQIQQKVLTQRFAGLQVVVIDDLT